MKRKRNKKQKGAMFTDADLIEFPSKIQRECMMNHLNNDEIKDDILHFLFDRNGITTYFQLKKGEYIRSRPNPKKVNITEDRTIPVFYEEDYIDNPTEIQLEGVDHLLSSCDVENIQEINYHKDGRTIVIRQNSGECYYLCPNYI